MEKLGKYTIVEKIGVGGFGEVYKGYDPFIKRYIAVKTCSTDDQEVRTRFFQEAEIAGNLHHRNVTTVHDFGIQDDLPYLIQEYLSGEDLDRKIKRREFLPFPEKLYYLLQIARGLGYAHSQGIIHRDIKPANIRVLEDGTTKIMDFGIARLAQQETGLTQTGMTLGTAAYLAPEQIRGENIDLRTDIFSFGVLAYELLAYERPFPGKQISTVLFSILNDQPKPLVEHWPGVPDNMVRLTDRCLEKDPQKRFANGTELSRELERIQKQGRAGGAPVDDGPTVLLSASALNTDSGAMASGATAVQGAVPSPPTEAPPAPSPSTAETRPFAGDGSSPRAAERPRRPVSDSHSLDQLELASGATDDERNSESMQTVIATPAPPQTNHSAKVALIIGLAILAGVAGWWFGARQTTEESAATPSTTQETVDVSGTAEPPPEDPPTSDGDVTTASQPSDTADTTETNTAAAPPPSEPPPAAPGTIVLQPTPWTDQLFAEVAGRRYPLVKRWPISLEPGSYRVQFRLDMADYQVEETVLVRLRAGETRQLDNPIERPGALSALALPGRRQGEVLLDDTLVGASPIRQRLVAPGSHTLTIRSPSGDVDEIVQSVTFEGGVESIVSFDLEKGRVKQSSKALPAPKDGP